MYIAYTDIFKTYWLYSADEAEILKRNISLQVVFHVVQQKPFKFLLFSVNEVLLVTGSLFLLYSLNYARLYDQRSSPFVHL